MSSKSLTRTLAALLIVPVFAAVACNIESGKDTPITDPTTGKVIGHKDANGNYVFSNGAVVRRDRISAVPRNEFSGRWNEGLQAVLTNPPKMASKGSSASYVGGSGGGCVGSCWNLTEGGASCSGCCLPAGGNACTCWESCTDKQSSSGYK